MEIVMSKLLAAILIMAVIANWILKGMRKINKTKNDITVKMNMIKEKKQSIDNNDDYAKTIFLDWYKKPKARKMNDEYPKYFLYECGIRNCQKYFDNLVDEGYLEETFSSSGLYVQSAQGAKFVTEHEICIVLHKHRNWGISYEEYVNCHRPDVGMYDTIWGILHKHLLDEMKLDASSFGRNQYHYMYEVLKEQKLYEKALEMLLRVLNIDISGSVYGIGYAPAIVSDIRKLGDYYSLDMIARAYNDKLPIKLYSEQEFENIVRGIICGTIDIDNAESDARRRYDESGAEEKMRKLQMRRISNRN